MNVSGIAIATQPEHIEALSGRINSLGWAEVQASDGIGRLIVMVEGDNSEQESERIEVLKGLPHVLSADMVVHYFEEEPPRTSGFAKQEQDHLPPEEDGGRASVTSFYRGVKHFDES